MIIEVQVPQLSESVAEGTLASWKKKIGESVARDEILIDIETDKVVLEVPAPDAGVLVEIIKSDGETVASGELIARIDTEAKAGAAAPTAGAPKAAAATPVLAAAPAAAAPAGTASPAARKILDEKGVAAAVVAGSGRGGRVTKEDAVAAQPQPRAAAPAGPVAAPVAVAAGLPTPATGVDTGPRTEQRVPMSRLRARIAERLLQSQASNACLLYTSDAADE